MFIVLYKVCTLCSTLYMVQWFMYCIQLPVHCTMTHVLHTDHFTLYNDSCFAYSSLYTIQRLMYCIQLTVYCTKTHVLHTAHCTLYKDSCIAYSSLYIVQRLMYCTQPTVHCLQVHENRIHAKDKVQSSEDLQVFFYLPCHI